MSSSGFQPGFVNNVLFILIKNIFPHFCPTLLATFWGYSPAYTIFSITGAIYNLTTLYLNGTLGCVDFMDVTMGYIPGNKYIYGNKRKILRRRLKLGGSDSQSQNSEILANIKYRLYTGDYGTYVAHSAR